MDAARPLVRLRWRLRGAWLWPTFVVLTLADAVIVHALPLSGDSASLVGSWLLSVGSACWRSLRLAPPLGFAVRRLRPDMPRLVARNYAGAVTTLTVSIVLLAAGLAHRDVIKADLAALQDASAARRRTSVPTRRPSSSNQPAPPRHLRVQPPEVYRSCAATPTGTVSTAWLSSVTSRSGKSGPLRRL